MVRRALCLGAAGLSVLSLVAGCGRGTPPAEWAGQVCAALGPWRQEIVDLNARTRQRMSGSDDAAGVRADLLDLLEGAQAASERARAAVAAAGTPDVQGGDAVARRFAGSLAGMRDAYAHARRDLEGTSTADPEVFYDAVVTILERLNREYARSAIEPSQLDSPELGRSFVEAEKCR